MTFAKRRKTSTSDFLGWDGPVREHFDVKVMICTLRKRMKFRESFGKLFLGTP
jgi:hypothetical protein